jgi:hypothetical protein
VPPALGSPGVLTVREGADLPRLTDALDRPGALIPGLDGDAIDGTLEVSGRPSTKAPWGYAAMR